MCVVFAIHTNRSLNETGRGRGTRIACINMWHTANFRFCRGQGASVTRAGNAMGFRHLGVSGGETRVLDSGYGG